MAFDVAAKIKDNGTQISKRIVRRQSARCPDNHPPLSKAAGRSQVFNVFSGAFAPVPRGIYHPTIMALFPPPHFHACPSPFPPISFLSTLPLVLPSPPIPSTLVFLVYPEKEKLIWQQILHKFLYTEKSTLRPTSLTKFTLIILLWYCHLWPDLRMS